MSEQHLIATQVVYSAAARVFVGRWAVQAQTALPCVCIVLTSVCALFHRLILTCPLCAFSHEHVFALYSENMLFLVKVAFDPHPHMRVPGMPPSLTGIPGGKP